jgi:hypothetical protein
MTLIQLFEAIHKAMFSNETSVDTGKMRVEVIKTPRARLRRAAFERKGRPGWYIMLEQNPVKNSLGGRLARRGHKISWILESKPKDPREIYTNMGVVNGEFTANIRNTLAALGARRREPVEMAG